MDRKITKNKNWRNKWKILSKSIAGTALSFCVKQLKADRPLLEPVMTRVSAPSKVSWGLHSTRYVQQQPTWSPGVAGRCPGPHASLRARQRHGLTPDLLLSSPGIQRSGRQILFSGIFHKLKKFYEFRWKQKEWIHLPPSPSRSSPIEIGGNWK